MVWRGWSKRNEKKEKKKKIRKMKINLGIYKEKKKHGQGVT